MKDPHFPGMLFGLYERTVSTLVQVESKAISSQAGKMVFALLTSILPQLNSLPDRFRSSDLRSTAPKAKRQRMNDKIEEVHEL